MQREVDRFFYASSFAHLAAVQQRQVGAVVGAAVGEAACRAVDGASPEEVAAACVAAAQLGRVLDDAGVAKAGALPDGEAEVAFLPQSVAPAGAAAFVDGSPSQTLSTATLSAVLSTLADGKALLYPDTLEKRLAVVRSSPAHVAQATVAARDATLHETAAVVPLAALYPYSTEEALEPYITAVMQCLHDPAAVGHALTERPDAGALPGTFSSPRQLATDVSLAGAATLCRFMMQSPDAVKNASFRAAPELYSIFEAAPGSFRPENAIAAPPPFAVPVLADARAAMTVARQSRSFAEGIRWCARRGGNASATALFAGALLGARFGVRAIPEDWLRATPAAVAISRDAVELAQWSWNPPSS